MREIKFRAWDGQTPYTYRLDYLTLTGDVSITQRLSNWQQYTGLKDKNGVEIYEGDILGRINLYKYKKDGQVKKNQLNSPNHIEVQEVTYGVHQDFASGWDFTNSSFLGWSFNPEELEDYWANELEVIGNIYENKDLLNGKANTPTE